MALTLVRILRTVVIDDQANEDYCRLRGGDDAGDDGHNCDEEHYDTPSLSEVEQSARVTFTQPRRSFPESPPPQAAMYSFIDNIAHTMHYAAPSRNLQQLKVSKTSCWRRVSAEWSTTRLWRLLRGPQDLTEQKLKVPRCCYYNHSCCCCCCCYYYYYYYYYHYYYYYYYYYYYCYYYDYDCYDDDDDDDDYYYYYYYDACTGPS